MVNDISSNGRTVTKQNTRGNQSQISRIARIFLQASTGNIHTRIDCIQKKNHTTGDHFIKNETVKQLTIFSKSPDFFNFSIKQRIFVFACSSICCNIDLLRNKRPITRASHFHVIFTVFFASFVQRFPK